MFYIRLIVDIRLYIMLQTFQYECNNKQHFHLAIQTIGTCGVTSSAIDIVGSDGNDSFDGASG